MSETLVQLEALEAICGAQLDRASLNTLPQHFEYLASKVSLKKMLACGKVFHILHTLFRALAMLEKFLPYTRNIRLQ